MRHLLLCLILTLVSTASSTLATPSAAVITQDQLIAANERSFFVLRSIAIHPGSYYQRSERLDLLEISVWDGSIRATCTLRSVTYAADPNTKKLNWASRENPQSPCNLAQQLSAAGASLTMPPPVGPPPWPLTLTDSGVTLQRGAGTAPVPLLDRSYVDNRARAMNQVSGVSFLWQSDDPTPFCPYCEATQGMTPTEACALAPQAVQAPMAPWVFLHLTCWDGSGDISGASLFIPVSRKTYDGATPE